MLSEKWSRRPVVAMLFASSGMRVSCPFFCAAPCNSLEHARSNREQMAAVHLILFFSFLFSHRKKHPVARKHPESRLGGGGHGEQREEKVRLPLAGRNQALLGPTTEREPLTFFSVCLFLFLCQRTDNGLPAVSRPPTPHPRFDVRKPGTSGDRSTSKRQLNDEGRKMRAKRPSEWPPPPGRACRVLALQRD